MEHLLKITKGLEPSTREHVTVENMKFLRKRRLSNRYKLASEWDNYYLVTGFMVPLRELKD